MRRRRRRRRPEVRDERWVAETFGKPSNAQPNAAESVRAVVRLVDGLLRAVEQTAWELRGIAEQTSSVWTEPRPRNNGAAPSEATDLRDATAAVPRRFRRLASTAWMLAQLAVTYRTHAFSSAFVSRDRARQSLDRLHEKNARRFYQTSVEQGGAFLKVGQLLSARHDLLPKAWVAELSKLQDEVPALPADAARVVIETEFAKPLTEVFSDFSEQPIAAASIGQVHRATTAEGQLVAVKVQRPGIDELIDADLQLLGLFLESIRSMLPDTDYQTIEREIRTTVTQETDYLREAQMMQRVADFFATHPSIDVPRPLSAHSTGRVLTSEFMEGRKITVVLDELLAARDAGDAQAGARLDRLLSLLLEAYVRMVLEAGVFQADPHPGNLLVTDDDRLVVLDFGATQPLEDAVRDKYLGVVRGFIFGDRAGLAALLDELGFRTRSGKPDTLLLFADMLLQQMKKAAESSQQGTGFSWPTKQQMFAQAAELLHQVEADPVVTIPAEFVMIARVFGTLGGLFMHYRPQIDYQKALLPVVGRALIQAWS